MTADDCSAEAIDNVTANTNLILFTFVDNMDSFSGKSVKIGKKSVNCR